MTKLPGGTITAVAKRVPIRQPFVVKITGGTGKYLGAKGKIVIAPDGAARNIYNISFASPSSPAPQSTSKSR